MNDFKILSLIQIKLIFNCILNTYIILGKYELNEKDIHELQFSFLLYLQRTFVPATSSAAPDSSESSSNNSSNNHHFNFGGNSSFHTPTTTTGNVPIFQPFQNQHNNPSSTSSPSAIPTTTTSSASLLLQGQGQHHQVTSPESSGIHLVRSSLEDDLADYENDTTSSSNKLPSEGGDRDELFDEDREAEAERDVDGVDS